MNERIRELIKQHDVDITIDGMGYGEGNIEDLIKLIIRECAKSANYWYQNHDKIHSDPMSYVLAHFGVGE